MFLLMNELFELKQARLIALARAAEDRYDRIKRESMASGGTIPVRHKCFISYHGADIDQVTTFVEDFGDVFIPRVVGASDSDDFKDPIDSNDEDYIKQQIGSLHLSDSTVTIVFVGRCTWSRKYVDWEIGSTLRDGSVNKRGGLMAITPPDLRVHRLPERFENNWVSGNEGCYARLYNYPDSTDILRRRIDDAYQARLTRAHLVQVGGPLLRRNLPC